MDKYTNAVREYLQAVQDVLAALDVDEIDAVARIFKKAYDEGRTIFVMGNGGSAATASHMACDINKGACLRSDKKFRVMVAHR